MQITVLGSGVPKGTGGCSPAVAASNATQEGPEDGRAAGLRCDKAALSRASCEHDAAPGAPMDATVALQARFAEMRKLPRKSIQMRNVGMNEQIVNTSA